MTEPSVTQQTNRETFLTLQASHVQQCRKEAVIALAIWLVIMVWSVSVMVMQGYVPPEQRPEIPRLIAGIPAWVFWGLFVPWFAGVVASWWFAAFVLQEDEPYADIPQTHRN